MNGKKLYKSMYNKKLAGVCGGIGEFFNIDANIIRLIFIALFILKGVGLGFYIVAALIMDYSPEDKVKRTASNARSGSPYDRYEPETAEPVRRNDNPFDKNGANDAPVVDVEYTEIRE